MSLQELAAVVAFAVAPVVLGVAAVAVVAAAAVVDPASESDRVKYQDDNIKIRCLIQAGPSHSFLKDIVSILAIGSVSKALLIITQKW